MSGAIQDHPFNHIALFYAGEDEFVARAAEFLRAGLAAGQPALVATSVEKCERLAGELNGASDRVEFLDMAKMGRNPATILPVWWAFAKRHRGRRAWGIDEPAWADRTPSELEECVHHESLLNLAFASGPGLELLCPYDLTTLDPEVIEHARRTHPAISEGGREVESPAYLPPGLAPGPFDGALAPPPDDAATLVIDGSDLSRVRGFVRARACGAGLDGERTHDLTLAVHELAANSVRHGGGEGALCTWCEDGTLLCEVRDSGRISAPLTGRILPDVTALSGRGLWVVNHLCDLVQIRSQGDGTVVRVRMKLDLEPAANGAAELPAERRPQPPA